MAWSVVQALKQGSSGAGPATLGTGNLGTNPTVNNRIIVVVEDWVNGSSCTATVADVPNGAYTKHAQATITDSNFHGEVSIHSVICTSNTATNPTATFSVTAGGAIVTAYEVSGLNTINGAGAVDVSAATAGTGGTASSGATGNTTAANEFAVFVYGDDGWGVSMATTQQDAAWTWGIGLSGGGTGSQLTAYMDSGGSGSAITGLMKSGVPGGSATWALAAVVFKLSGGAAAAPLGKIVEILAVQRAATW